MAGDAGADAVVEGELAVRELVGEVDVGGVRLQEREYDYLKFYAFILNQLGIDK